MQIRSYLVAVWLLVLVADTPAQQSQRVGPGKRIVDGLQLYRVNDPDLVNREGPVAVQALRVDARKMRLEIARGEGEETPGATVDAIARRHNGAIAAINGGFFSLETRKPTDLLKIDGEIVNPSDRLRGAVGILDRGGLTSLLFDRIAVFTSDGLAQYRPLLGSSPVDWSQAPHAVGGAGLLLLNGRELTDWTIEQISPEFDTRRHPRTVIGTDVQGRIWLITVDGRNPLVSVGMTFAELKRLARRLQLRSALNLDGGGSTTMWVDGTIVNHPSDREGPRRVSDAILVVPRKAPR